MNETETAELVAKIDSALAEHQKRPHPVMGKFVETPVNVEPETPKLATQESFEALGYTLPGLAYNPDGSITVASMVDLMMVCLAVMKNPQVDEVLKANSVALRDLNGKLVFPRAQT